jgi:hypothetical protein
MAHGFLNPFERPRGAQHSVCKGVTQVVPAEIDSEASSRRPWHGRGPSASSKGVMLSASYGTVSVAMGDIELSPVQPWQLTQAPSNTILPRRSRAGRRHPQRGTKSRAAGTDDDDVIAVLDDFIRRPSAVTGSGLASNVIAALGTLDTGQFFSASPASRATLRARTGKGRLPWRNLRLMVNPIERASLPGRRDCFCVRTQREATLSEFEGATPKNPVVEAKATAHLPRLDIEILHRRSPSGDAEQISIVLQAVPSFEAFDQFIQATNPFAFWVRAAWLAWSPWLEATRVAMHPPNAALRLPKDVPDAGDPEQRRSSS